jgi:Transposase IS66 family
VARYRMLRLCCERDTGRQYFLQGTRMSLVMTVVQKWHHLLAAGSGPDLCASPPRSGPPGLNRLYEASRKPGPIVEAMCWAHARRKFFDLARLNKAPIAIEAIERIDALFAIERDINGAPDNSNIICKRRTISSISEVQSTDTATLPGC